MVDVPLILELALAHDVYEFGENKKCTI